MIIRAARFLGVAPWELLDRMETHDEDIWLALAVAAESAEHRAAPILRRLQEQRDRLRGRR